MKKKLFRAALFLIALALLAAAYAGLTFRQRANGRPLAAGWKKGAYHLHSLHSDGRGTVDDIARAARSAGLDFVILTDHGRPNLGSSAATGWNGGVLVAGASEFSTHEGHLVAAGYRVPGYVFPPEAQEAVHEVGREGGVTFIAHPFDGKIPWSGWDVRGVTGIEVISLYQMAKKNLLRALILFPLQYLFNPDHALTALLSYPSRELEAWDRLNRQGRCFGIYGLDSHAKLALTRERSLHFPSYLATFRILNVYVRLEKGLDRDARAAAAALFAALRAGDFFSAIESLAPANGFDCFYLGPDGRRIGMGGSAAAAGGELVVRTPFSFATDVVVKKDGTPLARAGGHTANELRIPVTTAGVYRVEVALASGRFRALPWILANPVFIAVPAAPVPVPERVDATVAAEGEEFFQVEKNGRSLAVISRDAAAEPPQTVLSFTLHPERANDPDFWAAMAHRGRMSVAGRRGFVFEVRANRRLRCWLQFRRQGAGSEDAYERSFPADETWQQIAIPFDGFHRLYGRTPAKGPAEIDSFFFLVDGRNSYPGAQGEIFFRRIGLF